MQTEKTSMHKEQWMPEGWLTVISLVHVVEPFKGRFCSGVAHCVPKLENIW